MPMQARKIDPLAANLFLMFLQTKIIKYKKTHVHIQFHLETQRSPVPSYKHLSRSLLLFLPIFEGQFCSAY